MKRLTEKGFNFTSDFVKRSIDSWAIAQCLKKLQEYEDAEEKGLLKNIPCKVRDTVFCLLLNNGNPKYYECEIEQIIIHAGVIEMNALIKSQHVRTRINIEEIGKNSLFY